MYGRRRNGILLPICIVLCSGCMTAGGQSKDQTTATIFDTHRRVVKLDTNLDGAITKLNETTAELIARVNANDQEIRRLGSLVEENQYKLTNIEQMLGELRETVYRQWNISLGSSSYSAPSQGVVIESPDSETDTMDTTSIAAPVETPVVTGVVAGDPNVKYADAQKSYTSENYEKALSEFDAFLLAYPNDEQASNAQFWKAKALLRMGRYNEAISEFEKVRNSYPGSTKVPFAMHNQAVAHTHLGQATEAVSLMETVIDQYPISPAADQAKADLQKLKGN